MNTIRKTELVQEWGFTEYKPNTYKRNIFEGFTEWWSSEAPDRIEFFNDQGTNTETYFIDWALFN